MSHLLTTGIFNQRAAAAAAYPLDGLATYKYEMALIQLRTGITNVVKIRRTAGSPATADFTATQLTDGTAGAWVGVGNNGFVDTLYDQSGNGNHFTQATTAEQLKIINNGVYLGWMATNAGAVSKLDVASGIDTSAAHFVLLVASTACGASGWLRAGLFGTRATGTGTRGSFSRKLADGVGTIWYLGVRQANLVRQVRGTTALTANQNYLQMHSYNGTTYAAELNGTTETTATDTTPHAAPPPTDNTSYIGNIVTYEEDGQRIRCFIGAGTNRDADAATISANIKTAYGL